jgi:hypothetical protein
VAITLTFIFAAGRQSASHRHVEDFREAFAKIYAAKNVSFDLDVSARTDGSMRSPGSGRDARLLLALSRRKQCAERRPMRNKLAEFTRRDDYFVVLCAAGSS